MIDPYRLFCRLGIIEAIFLSWIAVRHIGPAFSSYTFSCLRTASVYRSSKDAAANHPMGYT